MQIQSWFTENKHLVRLLICMEAKKETIKTKTSQLRVNKMTGRFISTLFSVGDVLFPDALYCSHGNWDVQLLWLIQNNLQSCGSEVKWILVVESHTLSWNGSFLYAPVREEASSGYCSSGSPALDCLASNCVSMTTLSPQYSLKMTGLFHEYFSVQRWKFRPRCCVGFPVQRVYFLELYWATGALHKSGLRVIRI